MKKIFLIVIGVIILSGCSLGNTPTSRVESLFSDYQMLNNNIDVSYTYLTIDPNLDNNIINRYEKVIEKQYRGFSYEIKDEEIDGDAAVVTVQIEVMNYKNAIDKYDKGDYELAKYHDLVLNELEKTREMVTYTLEITLTKNNDDWVVDDLSIENRDKLLGIY